MDEVKCTKETVYVWECPKCQLQSFIYVKPSDKRYVVCVHCSMSGTLIKFKPVEE